MTERVGLTFEHDAGPLTPTYFFPQITGSGAAVLDFDRDGRMDVYLIHNGGPRGKRNQLFRQVEDGRFHDVSEGSGLNVSGYGMGAAVGDVDNDGWSDVILTEYGATRLFLNRRGQRFEETTRESGIDNPAWATSAALVDYNRDGWLDLVVVNYVDYDPSITCGSGGGRIDFCGPKTFPGSVTRLWRNRGIIEGRLQFEDVTVRSGLGSERGKGLGVLCADFDGDGAPDILVANDMMENHLWIQQKDGTFRNEAIARGLAYTATAASAANMGIAWADVDGDGLMDVFITHIIDETHTLWKQGPRGLYRDWTAAAGLTDAPRTTGFGTTLTDFDGDGWTDLAMVNGAVLRRSLVGPIDSFWDPYRQRHQLFVNRGLGRFQEISEANPALCGFDAVGRGLAVLDFDNDGAPDLLLTEISGPARLLRNVAPRAGSWLTVRARLARWPRDAFDAEIVVTANQRRYPALLNPGFSYCCSNDPRVFFGLGPTLHYDSIDVRWPGGLWERFPGGPANRLVDLVEGTGTRIPAPDRRRQGKEKS